MKENATTKRKKQAQQKGITKSNLQKGTISSDKEGCIYPNTRSLIIQYAKKEAYISSNSDPAL